LHELLELIDLTADGTRLILPHGAKHVVHQERALLKPVGHVLVRVAKFLDKMRKHRSTWVR